MSQAIGNVYFPLILISNRLRQIYIDRPRLCTRMASCGREGACPWKISGEDSNRAYGEAQANLRP